MCMCVSVYVCVCVYKSRSARTIVQPRTDLWGHLCMREQLARTSSRSTFHGRIRPRMPLKKIGKVLWNSVFYAVPFHSRVKRWLQRQITLTYWTEARWTKAMTSQVLRCTWPPRLGSVVIQIVLRLGVLGKRQGSVSCGYLFYEKKYKWYQLINDNVLIIYVLLLCVNDNMLFW